MDSKTLKELEDSISAQLNGYTCIVEIKNQTPPNMQIKIGGGCKFIYQDVDGKVTGEYTDYHNAVDIGSGGSLLFQSNQPNSCVKEVQVVVKAISPLSNERPTYGVSAQCTKEECLTKPSWTFGTHSKSLARQECEKSFLNLLSLKEFE